MFYSQIIEIILEIAVLCSYENEKLN